MYDRFGTANPRAGGYQEHGFNPFGNFDPFGDMFENFGFNFGNNRQQQRSRGRDIVMRLGITIYESIFGSKKHLEYSYQILQNCQDSNAQYLYENTIHPLEELIETGKKTAKKNLQKNSR